MIDKSLAIVDDNSSIPFSSLTNIIIKTAQYYFDNGVKQKENIAIIGYTSIEYVIAIYSLWKLGAIPVPINTRLKDAEIKSILLSSNCSSIIRDDNILNHTINIPTIKMLIKSDGKEYKTTLEPEPNDTAVIIHTSGSSGKPKGVKTTNNNLYQSYISTSQSFGFSNEDLFLASLPFYHIGGFSIINRALLSGGTLVLPKSLKQEDIVNSMDKYNPTIISLVPTMLKRMIEVGIEPNKSLRHLFLGGGPSDDELIYSSIRNKWPIVKVYGSSETTAMATACWGKELEDNPASAGKPFANIKIKILDDSKTNVANNVVGEIAIASPTIASGYINDENVWNSKIYGDFYLTGDYGYFDNYNNLFIVSRRTDLIVSGGENIDPREIEKIFNELLEVKESLVFPIKDSEWGEIPVAIISLDKPFPFSEKEIIDYIKSKISSYKIPKRILLVDELPKTALGKVNVEEIKEMFNNKS
ncbi:MAG: o-succinylbenzoate--CoA ligase [Melioribacteraceae bacterium]|jgi:O-succinylbenzoic acid--CoA ligase|nr:o-succinylbenzoate--CoA ligase [Melioribacteraceae bacterium]